MIVIIPSFAVSYSAFTFVPTYKYSIMFTCSCFCEIYVVSTFIKDTVVVSGNKTKLVVV